MQMMPINLEAVAPVTPQGAPAAVVGTGQFPQLLQQQLGAGLEIPQVKGAAVKLPMEASSDLAALIAPGALQTNLQLFASDQAPIQNNGLAQQNPAEELLAESGEGNEEASSLLAAVSAEMPDAQAGTSVVAEREGVEAFAKEASLARLQDGTKVVRSMAEALQVAEQPAEADGSLQNRQGASPVPPQVHNPQVGSVSLSDHRFAQLLQGKPVQEPAAKVKLSGELPQAMQPTAADAALQQGEVSQMAGEGLNAPATAPVTGQQEVQVEQPAIQLRSDAGQAMAGEGGRFAEQLAEAKAPEQGAGLKLSDGRMLPESQVVDQVVGRFTVNRSEQQSRMTMQLHPEELGQVKLELVVEKEGLKAHIQAQNHQVQDVLERHLPRLREALEQQGLRLDEMRVSVDSGQDGERGLFQHQQHQQPSFARRFTLNRGEGPMEPRGEDELPRTEQGVKPEGLSLRV